MRKILGRRRSVVKEPVPDTPNQEVKPEIKNSNSKPIAKANIIQENSISEDDGWGNNLEQIQELYSFSGIEKYFEMIQNTKSKKIVIQYMTTIQDSCKKYIQNLEDIGYNANAKIVRQRVIPMIEKLKTKINGISPNEFKTEFTKIRLYYNDSNPSNNEPSLHHLENVKEVFKQIRPTEIGFSRFGSPAQMIDASISFFLRRKLGDRSTALLKKLGCEFVPYSGGMVFQKARLIALNKDRFEKSNYKTAVNAVLRAISKNENLTPIFEISKELNHSYVVLCCTPLYIRTMMELSDSMQSFEIHIKDA